MEPEGSLPHLQVPATWPYTEPDWSSTCPTPLSEDLNIILPSTPGSSKWSLPQVSPANPICNSPLTPYVLHAPPISLFSIWSPEQYRASSTNH